MTPSGCKDLERENSRFKRLLADAELEKATLKEIAGETSKPERRRAAIHHLQRVLGDSERFACRIPGSPSHPTTPACLGPHRMIQMRPLRDWLRAYARTIRAAASGRLSRCPR